MRICMLADSGSIHVQDHASELARRGHDVLLVSYARATIPGVRTHTLKRGIHRKLRYIIDSREVQSVVEKAAPDILVAHYAVGYGYLAARSGFHPLVIFAWGSDVAKSPLLGAPVYKQVKRAMVRRALQAAELVLTAGQHLRERVIRLGVPPAKVVPFCFGVDLQALASVRNMSKPGDGTKIVSIRALEPIYDIQCLVNAIPAIHRINPRLEFTIVGNGSERERIADQVENMERVTLRSSLPRAELLRTLAEADIYVSTSLSDGASQSLLEAMAIGVFPVVSDIAANREWILDGKNGFLFELDYFL